ncbi:PLP-dependent aspartate aminotransferase family protein [Lachnospiraceae bacterium ZAX-1]
MNIKTTCVHGAANDTHCTGAITVPIYQSATFAHPSMGESSGYDYSRLQNPTREHLEQIVAKLENGFDALAFSSGMAAIATLMELFSIGDHIISSDDLYGGSIRYFDNISKKNGISVDYIDTNDLDKLKSLIGKETKAIFVETPTNPMMRVTDIAAVSKIAKEHDILLIVDNTFLTPYLQQPIALGADIVIHSGTKYLGGHNDTLAGFLICNSEALSEKLRFLIKTIGTGLSPFDSFLLVRGIKTLAIRMEKQEINARKVAEWMCRQPKIKAVHYVGLETHPDFELSKRQASGFGAMISFEVESEELACQILERIQLILFAESLGGVETLMTYPMTQTHADVPQEQREKNGINERLLRLSVGIEDIDDIISDLAQAIGDGNA